MMRKERPGTTKRKQLLMSQITEHVDAHLEEKLTLKHIATHYGVSVSTVTQMFQKYTDTTFHGFVTARRMVAAKKLIGKGVPLELAGKMVGYQDHSTFYRAFCRYFGVSPREYRNKLAEKIE